MEDKIKEEVQKIMDIIKDKEVPDELRFNLIGALLKVSHNGNNTNDELTPNDSLKFIIMTSFIPVLLDTIKEQKLSYKEILDIIIILFELVEQKVQ